MVATCVLTCCSGAVTRLAQLSHSITMMDRNRQAASIQRGRPERLQRDKERKNDDCKHRANEAIFLVVFAVIYCTKCESTVFRSATGSLWLIYQIESCRWKLRPPRHAAQEVVLRRGVLRVLHRVFPFPSGFGGAPLTAAPHTCKETEPSVRLANAAFFAPSVPGRRARFSPWGLWV